MEFGDGKESGDSGAPFRIVGTRFPLVTWGLDLRDGQVSEVRSVCRGSRGLITHRRTGRGKCFNTPVTRTGQDLNSRA